MALLPIRAQRKQFFHLAAFTKGAVLLVTDLVRTKALNKAKIKASSSKSWYE